MHKSLDDRELPMLIVTNRVKLIEYYENRAKNPSTTFVITAANELGITTDELLGVPPAKIKPAVKKSKLDICIEQVKKLPKSEQKYVVKFLEQVVGRNKD
jgi:hypothetical protein